MALINYEMAIDQRGDYIDIADALRAYRENVGDTAGEKANAGEWFHIEKNAALDFYDDLVEANKDDPTSPKFIIPVHSLIHHELVEIPRSSFTQEEFDSLDKYTKEEIHINDAASAKRINDMTQSLVNRIDWVDEGNEDDPDEYFSEGIKYASKQPDFLDTVPDDDGNIGDLINKYGPILGVPRVERALLSYLDDADEYEKSYDDYYYPSRAGYFQIGASRNFYFGPGDIEGLENAYPDEIRSALIAVDDMRPGMVGDLGLSVKLLLEVRAGGEYQADLDPTSSYGFTPKWDYIVESIEEELNEEMPDVPIPTNDRRTYEERKIYTFEDGAYWVELTTEELPEEGRALGHCIGDLEHGHPQGVADGTYKVYSLRTASGRSKLTVEIGPLGHVRDVRGKGNRLVGWSGSVGEGKVKWMEVQKFGKLLDILNARWPLDEDFRKTLEAVKEVVGGPVFTQNPGVHCAFCNEPPRFTQNPKGFKEPWWERPLPKKEKTHYKLKRDALNVFIAHNQDVIDLVFDGMDRGVPESYDNINRNLDLEGDKKISTFAEALWLSLGPERPFYIEEIDVDMLNDTPAMQQNGQGMALRLPDFIEEIKIEREQAEYYEQQEDEDEVPF
jgi:hypothetical protein